MPSEWKVLCVHGAALKGNTLCTLIFDVDPRAVCVSSVLAGRTSSEAGTGYRVRDDGGEGEL